jgi:hypothetical protein
MEDHFRPIEGYPAYRVSRDGEIRVFFRAIDNAERDHAKPLHTPQGGVPY